MCYTEVITLNLSCKEQKNFFSKTYSFTFPGSRFSAFSDPFGDDCDLGGLSGGLAGGLGGLSGLASASSPVDEASSRLVNIFFGGGSFW